MAEVDYVKAVRDWRLEMDAAIRRENNWSTLAGLFWLKPGANSLGSSPDCDVRLPKEAPARLGTLRLDGTLVTLEVDAGQRLEVNGAARASTPLRTDQEPPASSLTWQDLRMSLIRRGGRVGLRLWDSRQRREFPPRSWFNVDDKFRVAALYTPYPAPLKVELPNAAGENETGYMQGSLTFKLGGKACRLEAAELDDGRLFLQFADLTNGTNTYPAGRYLYTEPVQEDGHVFVDFNKAFNPPSAFNEFEPCNFAPPGNHLTVEVEAGELYLGGYETSIQSWRSELDASLRGDSSWVTLVGLFWLKEGVNTLGSSPDSDIHLPKEAPRLLGAIRLAGGAATLEFDTGQNAEVNGAPVHAPTALRSDQERTPSIVTWKHLRMALVREGSRVGLRLWDSLQARELPHRTWFDVDVKFRVRALYTPYPVPVKVDLPSIFGETETGLMHGYVSFQLDGKSFSLDAAELEDGRLWLQFGDGTNGVSTYPRGRHLRTERLQEDGRFLLDFNRACNPPAAFKEFEPCTFAPAKNRLNIAIQAGEQFTPRS